MALAPGSESEVPQSCLTLRYPMDCSLPGSSIHGIFQAIVLEWIAISFSRASSRPRDGTQVSRIVCRQTLYRLSHWGVLLRLSWGNELCIAACKPLVAACGIQFPDQGMNLGPLQRECGILATGPPGKSWEPLFYRIPKLAENLDESRGCRGHWFSTTLLFKNSSACHNISIP